MTDQWTLKREAKKSCLPQFVDGYIMMKLLQVDLVCSPTRECIYYPVLLNWHLTTFCFLQIISCGSSTCTKLFKHSFKKLLLVSSQKKKEYYSYAITKNIFSWFFICHIFYIFMCVLYYMSYSTFNLNFQNTIKCNPEFKWHHIALGTFVIIF